LLRAGRGLRFGGSSPKQLLTLGGRPILARSVDAFVACDAISEIVVALPADLAAAPPSYLEQRGKPVTVVSGGDERRYICRQRVRARLGSGRDCGHSRCRTAAGERDLIRRTGGGSV
jgi:2-C-methyl-D-erythritol 4-phosphate cytidylyltransferase